MFYTHNIQFVDTTLCESMVYKALKLNLSEKQIMDALKGKRIKVTPGQINTGNTFISLHPVNAKKVESAYLKKKGFLLTLSHGELAETAQRMDGSGFWGNVWNALKKGWKVLKDSGALTALADAAVAPAAAYTGSPALVAGARKLLKDTTGVGVAQQQEAARKRMTKNDKFEMLRGAGIYLA